MAVNQATIDLIKRWEGLMLGAYRCPAGVLTIGYGHTSAAGAPEVVHGMTITEADAEAMLRRDLGQYESAVDSVITAPINANQRGAYVSLCYNIGPQAFTTDASTVKYFNLGDMGEACRRIALWNKMDGKVLQGLINRREAEQDLFMTPVSATERPPEAVQPVQAANGAECPHCGRTVHLRAS